MPLFCLVGAGNFRFISLLPFFSIVGILSVQAISSQILYTFFPRFPWWTFLHFPSYFNFSNLTYLRIDVFTHDMTIPPKMVLNYHILDLHNNIHPITKNISWHPINQSYPTRPDHSTLYPMQPRLIQNNKFPCFTTIQ